MITKTSDVYKIAENAFEMHVDSIGLYVSNPVLHPYYWHRPQTQYRKD